MTPRAYETLFTRHARNPILTAADWPYPVHSVFNPGAVRLQDGSTLLLCRVEDRRGHSHLSAARSPNGVDQWVIDAEPTLKPEIDRFPEELCSIPSVPTCACCAATRGCLDRKRRTRRLATCPTSLSRAESRSAPMATR